MYSSLVKLLKFKDSYLRVVMIEQRLSIGMRMMKQCLVQISLTLLLEKQCEWMNNFNYIEVQE
jgi:hypothetical protein